MNLKELSFRTRQDNLARFGEEIFDLIILGGGITGAGAAIAAAIDDALGRPGAVTRLPVTPVRLHALLTHSTRSPNYS